MIRLEMKNWNLILTDGRYHLEMGVIIWKWALSFGKINKNEYLTSEEILPSDQRRVIKQAKFAYSTLGKALEKQAKTIQDQGKKNK